MTGLKLQACLIVFIMWSALDVVEILGTGDRDALLLAAIEDQHLDQVNCGVMFLLGSGSQCVLQIPIDPNGLHDCHQSAAFPSPALPEM